MRTAFSASTSAGICLRFQKAEVWQQELPERSKVVPEREVLPTVGKGVEETGLREAVGTGKEGGVGGCNLLGTQVLTLRRCLDKAGEGKQADGRPLEV